MLSKGKQITLGIFTVIGFSVAATLSAGRIAFIDTIEFAFEKPILLCVCYVLYFAAFIIYAALAKRKNLEVLAKTTIISGAIPAATCLFIWACDWIEGLHPLIREIVEYIVMLLYPMLFFASPFFESYVSVIENIGMFVLFAAPIIAGIIYLFTKRPNKTEEPGTQVLAEKG